MKNNKGTEETRARHLDYCVQINGYFYNRLLKGKEISLFSPHDVPGLYDAFFADQEEFARIYEEAEQNDNIHRITMPAMDVFQMIYQERASTGRIYIMNVDHVNNFGPFNPKHAPVTSSNLCVSGDTTVLIIEDGELKNRPIRELEGKVVVTWNGTEWTEAYCDKTSEEAKLYSVKINILDKDGTVKRETVIKATAEHKWYDLEGQEYRTSSLTKGVFMKAYLPAKEPGLDYYTAIVDSIEEHSALEPTWCLNEPKQHKVTFNGILTGNCLEIALPTKPLTNILDDEGEIALCTLAAVNLGTLESLDELENLQDLLVRCLDAILEYQDYPVKAAKKSVNKFRPLGIGVINYAYYLAKNNANYSTNKGNNLTHRTFEAFEYYAIKASVQLAKEKGACEAFEDTRWAQGILPIDRYKEAVDELHTEELHCDWDSLREDIKKYGIRNATLTALMPSESSSTVSNATNGIEPPRYLTTVKSNKDMTVKQVVPDIMGKGFMIETAWEMKGMKGYIEKVAIMQKFICQAISANAWYKPSEYPGGLLPMKVIIQDQINAYKYGIKTWYYHNTHDGANNSQGVVDDGCEGGACKI